LKPLVFREALPVGEPEGTLLCVHGYPASSHMWNATLEAAARAGWRALAPDLHGYGDSPLDGSGTWAEHVAALGDFVARQALGPVVLAVHDWGGLIGLRWACEAGAGAVRGLVVSNTGFFPDGKWHGMAQALRTEGAGEELVDGLDREGFSAMLRAVSTGMSEATVNEYWKASSTPERRHAQLALYRSGDFSELARYDLATLAVPALVLWGEEDRFAPVAGAHRFAGVLDARAPVTLEVFAGVGHFLFEDEPAAAAEAVAQFLATLEGPAG
jgi:haloalkane dehalogenase